MLDDLFPFMDTVIELNEDNACFVIQADILYDFMQKIGLDKKPVLEEKIEVPIDIAMSLLEQMN
jgi:hypothetical protein